jgi:hypothetical protein
MNSKAQYAQSKAQYAPCVPVPDHMPDFPFHVIGYWHESKPTLAKIPNQKDESLSSMRVWSLHACCCWFLVLGLSRLGCINMI